MAILTADTDVRRINTIPILVVQADRIGQLPPAALVRIPHTRNIYANAKGRGTFRVPLGHFAIEPYAPHVPTG